MHILNQFITALAFSLLFLCILVWILKSPLQSFIVQITEFWRKSGWVSRIGILTAFLTLWIYASVKPTNQTSYLSQQIELVLSGASSSVQGGLEIIPPETVTCNGVAEVTAAQAAAGFCILSVETNLSSAICWSTNSLPANTTVLMQENWSATGRYNDGFWLNTTNLDSLCAFRLNSEDVYDIFISSSGTISFYVPKGTETARSMPTSSGISFLAPLWGSLGIKPGPDGSSVWVASTTNHNLLVTWENVLIDRIDSSNNICSVQCLLCNNGDFSYRYSVSPGLILSNHVVGAQNNGYGESVDLLNTTNSALCVNALEIVWSGFQSYTMDAGGDTDGDGIPDNEEIRIYRTSPTLVDSDGDNWSDSYEITNTVCSTDPLNADSDNDGIIDSVDGNPLTWDDIAAVNTNDGYTTQYHIDNGFDPVYDFSQDSDTDGTPDWLEEICGTPPDVPSDALYLNCDYFDVTITLAADLPVPVLLKTGDRTLVLRTAGTRTVRLPAGAAHAVSLLASDRCFVFLGISFSTGGAVIVSPSAVFTGGTVLPAGAEQAAGTVALPVIGIDPGVICFHSSASKSVTAAVTPDMPGSFDWTWPQTGEESNTYTGRTVSITWPGEGYSETLELEFTAEGATDGIYAYRYVTRCRLTENDPGGGGDDWFEEGTEPAPWEWPQQYPLETGTSPATNSPAQGEPSYAAKYGLALAVNNDDDDADGILDSDDTDGVSGENDIYGNYLYTPFTGSCCPCPSHNPAVSSASIEYLSTKLRIWNDAAKTTAATGVTAGQKQYVEGVSPSTSVAGEPIILSWTEDGEYMAKTNRYTLFSLRMFGDYDFDGSVNSNDYAAASELTEYGWIMPVASNVLRKIQLRTDVLITGNLILSLSGSAGIRIWDTPNPAATNTPLLVAGQTITNGVDGVSFASYPTGMLYVEAIDSGTDTLTYTYVGTGDAEGYGCSTVLKITALRFGLIPDYNRDGSIDQSDSSEAATNAVYYFWVNDDDDSGCEGGDDIPGLTGDDADCNDLQVDGVKDFVDFMPVFLDLKDAVEVLGYPEYSYILRHEDGALNALMPSYITPENCTRHLHDTDFCELYKADTVVNISSTGVELVPLFLLSIEDEDGGVILLEGKESTTEPLILEVKNKTTGDVMFSRELELNISPVEDMYQRVNLRNGSVEVTQGSTLPPDSDGNVFFLHGFRVTSEGARGWLSEMFKRLRQSGSNARFHGVTWYGDECILNAGFHYHENVNNAFETAPHLSAYVNGIPGQRVVMAHSLGNMVVSSAVADHGMSVEKYFMLNAAVASEAFDDTLWSDSPDAGNRLVHNEWRGYTNVCWCAKWHEFFTGDTSDDRRLLTWKERFSAVLSGADVYNYYSSGSSANTDDGDQVFEMLNETPSSIEIDWDNLFTTAHFGRYAWQKQETHKGRGTLDPAGTSWAGWEFARNAAETTVAHVTMYPNAQAVNATNDVMPLAFVNFPVFRKNPPEMFTNSIPVTVRNELLAVGIPALSPAAGKTTFSQSIVFNLNMNVDFKPTSGDWGRDGIPYYKRWLHNDLREMAYLYTHLLFDELVDKGDLR